MKKVRCDIHNHDLAKALDRFGILYRLKFDERQFVNDMTKYHMALRSILGALKDRNHENQTSVPQLYKAR